MSNFDWSNYQKMDPTAAAQQNIRSDYRGFIGNIMSTNEYKITEELTDVCNNMAADFGEALLDENEYDLEVEERTIEDIKKELDEKNDEKAELIKKLVDGTITDEERERLEELSGEIKSLKSELFTAIKDEIFIANGLKEAIEETKSITETAEQYAEETTERGNDIIDKWSTGFNGFLARLGFGQDKVQIGENAVTSGTNLDQVVTETLKASEEVAATAEEAVQTAETAETAQTETDAVEVTEEEVVDNDATMQEVTEETSEKDEDKDKQEN